MRLLNSVEKWLYHEQTLNEPIDRDPDGRVRVLLDSRTVRREYRPENQPQWPQEVVWLPQENTRTYGPVAVEVGKAFGCNPPKGCLPFFLHPQAPASHRRLREAYGSTLLPGVQATPASSYRTVLTWCGNRRPVCLKLSMGAVISGVRRALREEEVASAVVISRLLATILPRVKERVGLDWFSEPAGVVDTASGTGWLLRRLPQSIGKSGSGWMLPAFSLISRRGEAPPLLCGLIESSGSRPEEFVLERIIRPYVSVLSYLLLEEGIHVEGHTQNVLFEADERCSLTGRIFLRDLSDMSVDIAHRIARKKPLPDPGKIALSIPPFSLPTIAGGHRSSWTRSNSGRAATTVNRYGLLGFVWSVNASLSRFYPNYKTAWVEREYLRMWQEEITRSLAIRCRLRPNGSGLQIDDALRRFHRGVAWEDLGARPIASIPPNIEPLIPDAWLPRGDSGIRTVECPWGELLIAGRVPAYFAPTS